MDVFNAGAGDDTIIINASNITALEQTFFFWLGDTPADSDQFI
jgi:hypothetical protein